jgi:DNA sulfur modification protein DndE
MVLFTVSKAAKQTLDRLQSATGIRSSQWTRVAFGLSLNEPRAITDEKHDSGGSYFHDNVFFGDDEAAFLALLREHAGRAVSQDEIGQLIKRHVDRGVQLLGEEFDRGGRSGERLLLSLISTVADDAASVADEAPSSDGYLLRLTLGQTMRGDADVVVDLNRPGTSPHVAIMGRSGSGKTRCAKKFLTQLAKVGSRSIPLLVFDYAKGDIAGDDAFVRSLDAKSLVVPDELVPLVPIACDSKSDLAVTTACFKFRDTVNSVVHLGPKQRGNCVNIVERAFKESNSLSTKINKVFDVAEAWYQEKGLKPDSLLETLREMAAFPMFDEVTDTESCPLLERSHVIDIHGLPDSLRKMLVFLTLDRLYSYIWRMPDSPLDAKGNRECRLIIVIDEAHHYLPCKQPTLEKLVREGRSKGVFVWLLSQSPDDFDQSQYNFAREIGLTIVFSCVVENPRILEAVLGGNLVANQLSQLGTGVALTRVPGQSAPTAVQMWKP